MPNTILSTKLYIPLPRRDLVPRPRLIERLDTGLRGKLTVVSAPAGYGKTTLVSDWVARSPVPAAWLSLDAADNDIARFFSYLSAGLQQIHPDVGADIQPILETDGNLVSRPGRILSRMGSVSGVVSGICLVGAAFTPMDVQEPWHFALVTCAFGVFAAATVLYANAIRRERDYPNRFALLFDGFSILLLIYLLLVMLGPPRGAPVGMVLQATAQKIIVYASVTCIFIQAYGAKALRRP